MDSFSFLWHGDPADYGLCMMTHVFSPFSALLSLDASGTLLGVCQFDSYFGTECIAIHPKAVMAHAFFNHPDGYPKLHDEEMNIVFCIRQLYPDLPLSVFIAGEDIGCIPICL